MKEAVLEQGQTRYVVGEFLAEGGMGAIYLGRRAGANGETADVVLKALLPEFTQEQPFIDLFLREARLTASLDHPNIVRTLDLVTGAGTWFIVMEYVRGADLRTLQRRARRRGRPLSPEAALYAGIEILDALGYAHSRLAHDGTSLGLIHRDISPSNILVGGDGAVKLSDFGIAKLSTHRSVLYKVKGKVGYMSPEQAQAEPVDARSDLFSLAVCLWEGLAGERLYAATPMATAQKLYQRPPPPVSARNPDLPAALDEVIRKALEFDPRRRFQSAAEMRAALVGAAEGARLRYRREQFAAHLQGACGPDARQWLRGDTGDERCGGTEVYQPGTTDAPSDGARAGRSADGEGHARTRTALEGTALTSVLDGESTRPAAPSFALCGDEATVISAPPSAIERDAPTEIKRRPDLPTVMTSDEVTRLVPLGRARAEEPVTAVRRMPDAPPAPGLAARLSTVPPLVLAAVSLAIGVFIGLLVGLVLGVVLGGAAR